MDETDFPTKRIAGMVSHGLPEADDFVAVSALMLLIVACGDAEGDQAAAEGTSNEAEHEAQDPG